jgi:biofilm PGA synthesis N-glycosyltransferase PgaC
MNSLSYVLVTPARNESQHIEKTLQSVINQTRLPIRWIIVSDGSTDGTDSILKHYAARYSWVETERMPERKERHFAGKACAFKKGYERIRQLSFDIVGSLDADISFEPGYFEFLLEKFAANPELGVAGTPFREGEAQYDYRFSRKEHVSGACQLFRRECFEAIGGYEPLERGAIDLVAVVSARMKGWRTETFTEKACIHHRPMGTAKHGILMAALKSGYGDYIMGVHPIWQILRSLYQMGRRPVLMSGAALLCGYLMAAITCAKKPVSRDFVSFRKKEQLAWLKEILMRFFGLGDSAQKQ